jgi:regulator of protease activity HflC (stomatin/prohibitin superfamily)
MLTGDENIVDAQVVVQYRVRDAADYLFNVRNPEQAIHAATEVALRSVVGRNTIDYVMIEGRSTVQDETMTFLQRLMDDYGSGLQITVVKLQYAGPPEEVKDAFDEVVRAREDKEKLMREAEGYAADRVPKARGEAEQMVLTASAYRDQRVLRAEGDAAKFLQVLREHEVPAAFQALAESGVSEAIQVLAQIGAIKEGLAEEEEEAPGMTRETLGEILIGLGVAEEDQQPEDLTGQKLREILAQLGIVEEYEEAYQEAMRLTRERLYLETIEDVLAGTEKFVIDPQTGGNLMPFLPLKELTGSEKPQEAKQ